MPNSAGIGLPHGRSYSVADGIVTDGVTGLVWQQTVPAQRRSWSAAKEACQALVLGGRDDWRLPSRIELVSLIENRRSDPSLDLTAFPFTAGAGLGSDWFWTSTPAAGDPAKAWYVYFYFGYPDVEEQSSEFAVRCVRGGPTAAQQPGYEIVGETVRDTGTGLVWQRGLSPTGLDFATATQHCADLVLGDSADWRLPTLTELETLVDDSRVSPAIHVATFPDSTSEPFWTSTVFSDAVSRVWYVRFDGGGALYERDDVTRRVRCVR